MKKMFGKINETGTMLVEAMAMLGLIAMVTPILYKKAAERTTELQDINASNQLRILADAMDSYIKDNFARINEGEVVQNGCQGANSSVDYKNFDDGHPVSFNVAHLCEYLPYGFLKNGVTQDSKLFSSVDPSFNVVLRKTTGTETDADGKEVVIAETITGFLTAVPNEGEDFPSNRVARIATMVGSNGGYVEDDGEIMGAQGIWSLSSDDELGLNLDPRTFVVSSLQPISSQGLANEDVLHRKTERQNDYLLNSMETDLFMSYNNKNHNIRMVNQIIMRPQPEWMLGGTENDFMKNSMDDTPTPTYGEYKPELDYTLYIGEKGGAYIEGNMAALDSLFTVRSEAETDGGIKYYGTAKEMDNTDPSNPVEKDVRGDSVFSVTTEKMEYGNIGDKAAGVLLTVNKGADATTGALVFESKTTGTDGEGKPTSSTQKLVDANPSRVNVLDGALSVRNPGIAADGGRYDMYDTDHWPQQNAAPAVVVGGGDVHKGSYTTYKYNPDGTPVVAGDGALDSADFTDGEHALTVNGPAFIKDSLKTAKLKAYNVDAAKLRGGTKYEDFNDATKDSEFYFVAEQRGADATAKEGRLLVGPYADGAAGENNYRLQIAEADALTDEGHTVEAGIKMNHEAGINLVANDPTSAVDIGFIDYANDGTKIPNKDTMDGQLRLGAHNAVLLSTMDINGNHLDGGVVSIQDDMLEAYYSENVNSGAMLGYIDSVTDYTRFVSTNLENINRDSLYERDMIGNEGLFALGDMDFTVNEDDAFASGVARPVVDIKAKRQEGYISSRFSGGLAVYDHDVAEADYPSYPSYIKKNDTSTASIGNPSLYVNKGDFQILATTDNELNSIKKGDIILQVDNNSDETVIADDENRGSVYIRKGAINIAGKDFDDKDVVSYGRLTNLAVSGDYVATKAGDASAQGYIAADRFIAHTGDGIDALKASSDRLSLADIDGINSAGNTQLVSYERFEVNPAYTSVMHDIKLTTRGGARLSDILPDFINKGIYVVNNTYKDNTPWTNGVRPKPDDWDLDADGNNNKNAEEYTSAYLGFVPTPTCPQGYSKVVTINPSGWAMSQTGTPTVLDGETVIDIATHNNPYLYWYTPEGDKRTDPDMTEEPDPVTPLTFQKSTWIRAMVLPNCNGFAYDGKCVGDDLKNFQGWGTVLGFIYPGFYYKDFIEGTVNGNKLTNKPGSAAKGEVQNNDPNNPDTIYPDTIYWNLFPVQYKQLEAYVTVYCYFNRQLFDERFVDTTYDQLGDWRKTENNNDPGADFRGYYKKPVNEYSKRLNDPNLKYTDPW